MNKLNITTIAAAVTLAFSTGAIAQAGYPYKCGDLATPRI
jgi:hypothetical protein